MSEDYQKLLLEYDEEFDEEEINKSSYFLNKTIGQKNNQEEVAFLKKNHTQQMEEIEKYENEEDFQYILFNLINKFPTTSREIILARSIEVYLMNLTESNKEKESIMCEEEYKELFEIDDVEFKDLFNK